MTDVIAALSAVPIESAVAAASLNLASLHRQDRRTRSPRCGPIPAQRARPVVPSIDSPGNATINQQVADTSRNAVVRPEPVPTPPTRKMAIGFGIAGLLAVLLAATWLYNNYGMRRSPIDLLARIDLEHDVVAGDWKRVEGRLLLFTSEKSANQPRIQIPVHAPDEYRLTLVVERQVQQPPSRRRAFMVGFPAADTQGMLVIDGFDGHTCSLERIDGKAGKQNGTAVDGAPLPDGRRTTIELTVRKSTVELACDSRTILTWKGDLSRLSLDPNWQVWDAKSFLLGGRTVRYSSLRADAPFQPSLRHASAIDSPAAGRRAVGRGPGQRTSGGVGQVSGRALWNSRAPSACSLCSSHPAGSLWAQAVELTTNGPSTRSSSASRSTSVNTW